MRIHFRPILLLTAVLVLALLAGCQGQAEPTLDTTALAENIAVNIFGTLTAQPTNTLSATPTSAAPVVIANTDVPLRAGPGREFSATRRLDAGTPAAILAISEDGRWVQVSPREEPFSEYGDGGWVGLSPQISISGELSDIPVQDVMITPTENTYEISRITATAAAENILALIPPRVTPAPTH
ncbi:MAG TPA: hypothetical protein VHO69_03745, partial [Phototrophicaceae bacterium]|nr:hypothetical protein [Phototrophicaceae bacterium]